MKFKFVRPDEECDDPWLEFDWYEKTQATPYDIRAAFVVSNFRAWFMKWVFK